MERDETRQRGCISVGEVAARVVERLKDRVADQFRDLGNYGVSEGGTAVHDVGKPISHSIHVGFGRPRNMSSSRVCDFWPFGLIKYLPVHSPVIRGELPDLHGVGHNPYSVAEMGGANVGSWYAVPLRVIPERGQVGEDDIEAPNKEGWRVFQDDKRGSKFPNQTGDFGPKAAAFASDTLTPTGQANVLTGETGCNDIDAAALGAGECPHVIVARDIGPMLGEDFAREAFDFTERDGFEAIDFRSRKRGAFKPEAEAADAAEKIEHAQFRALWLRAMNNRPVGPAVFKVRRP